jgi:hypothetical protein
MFSPQRRGNAMSDPIEARSAIKRRVLAIVVAVFPLAAAWAVSPTSARADPTVLTVDTTAQKNSVGDLPTNCTLGDALVAANTDAPDDSCTHPNIGTGGPFEIVLPPDTGPYTLSFGYDPGAGPADETGTPVVEATIAIRGNGNRIQRDPALPGWPSCRGWPAFRIFRVGPDGDLTLDDLVVHNGCFGADPGFGGGVLNDGGRLTVRRSTFFSNAGFFGGAIANANGGLATIEQSSFFDNVSIAGAAIYNEESTLLVSGSSLRHNTGEGGVGIENAGGVATVVNTTISGNDGSAAAGGVYNSSGTTSLLNVTLAGNTGHLSGNGLANFGTLILTNVVLDNEGPVGTNCWGDPISDGGHNIEDGESCGFTDATSRSNLEPLLGPLADNGGPTQTHALLPGSPAIDAGDDGACPEADQRDVPRPLDGDGDGDAACDIGAFEASACADQWLPATLTTVGKGQSRANNGKVSHEIYGHIVGGAVAYGEKATRIKLCRGTPVEIDIRDDTGVPGVIALTDGIRCDASGCSVELLRRVEKYKATSQDGKDTDRVTLIPAP